ncbi:MAG TPA: STAS domain-containing protein [Candidatus Brocadiia bacterium]|nr:STAS domain-containing protein [Candidatus Brocadiia bacterium]
MCPPIPIVETEAQQDAALIRVHVKSISDPALVQTISDAVKAAAALPGARIVALDVGEVAMFTTVFLGRLVSLRKTLKGLGVELRLCRPSPHVRESLNYCKLDRLIPVYGAVAEALA